VGAHHLRGAAGEEQPPAGEHDHPVAVAHRLVDRLGREHQRQAAGAQLVEPGPEPVALVRAEAGGRLVEQQDARSPGEGDGEVEPLERPGGQLGRGLAGEADEVGAREQLVRGGVGVADALEGGEQPQVLPRREARIEGGALGHPAHPRGDAVGPRHGAGAGAPHAGEDRQERGLAGAVGPEERDRLPAAKRQVDPVQGGEVAVAAAEAARHQQGRAGVRHRRRIRVPAAASSRAIVDHGLAAPARPWRAVARLR
jgi:hypothetical protein